jgi:serine/threonine-protein kinase
MSTGQGKIFSSGDVIQDKWVILEFIDKGAFGEVYRAHQLNLQRDVAIKVVSQDWLNSTLEDDEEIDIALQRFRREVHAMAHIRHPNVLQVFDNGSMEINKNGNGYPVEFIVMEYVPGDTLRFTMSEEGFYPEQDLLKEWLENYYFPMLNGVKAIHALDMVHRDLKPENVLMDGQIPKITDFGLARSSRLKPITQSMDVKGTANYMSPEHFFDFRKADHRADIYSLGKILFEAVAGKIGEGTLPFKTATLENPETRFFEALDRIIQDATAEKKEERTDSVDKLHEVLRDAIDTLDDSETILISEKLSSRSFLHKPQWVWSGIAIAVISVTIMTFWHIFGEPDKTNTGVKSPVAFNEKRSASDPPKISAAVPSAKMPPGKSILAEDGATLQFIPGGELALPENLAHTTEEVRKVDSFYLDEAPVTNHQYVQFLNQNLSTLTIERGVVRAEDEIWLLLGEIFEGYTPVVFKKGKFQVSKASYASTPVLRVTALGAEAYARFYNRRLPTLEEWIHALAGKEKPVEMTQQHDLESMDSTDMEKMHNMMIQAQSEKEDVASRNPAERLSPVSAYAANKLGIREIGKGFSEWSLRGMTTDSEGFSLDFDYILMPEGVPRQPWEAFEEVGFRCAQDIDRKSAELK